MARIRRVARAVEVVILGLIVPHVNRSTSGEWAIPCVSQVLPAVFLSAVRQRIGLNQTFRVILRFSSQQWRPTQWWGVVKCTVVIMWDDALSFKFFWWCKKIMRWVYTNENMSDKIKQIKNRVTDLEGRKSLQTNQNNLTSGAAAILQNNSGVASFKCYRPRMEGYEFQL